MRVRCPISGRSLLLDAAFHSPAAITDLAIGARDRMITLPACIFKTIPKTLPSPFGSALPPSSGFSAFEARSSSLTRCLVQSSELPGCHQASTPLWDLSIPRDRSAQLNSSRRSLPSRVARSSFAPRYAVIISYSSTHRINVPDPLLPARLAVLRTSWNHDNDAPNPFRGQP